MSDVLLDSCVVLDLTDPDGAWFERSAGTLESRDAEARFLIDPVVYAEVSVGTKTGVLADCFIGAHAAVCGYRLMTRDTRRFATHFPTVELVCPAERYG